MKTHAVTFVRAALVTACATGLSLSLFAGKDYYVDANYGHDDWDGSTAAIPTEEQKQLPVVPGPRKTLAAAMAISGLAAGDTVHAAPGVYNEGGMNHATCGSNRVIVADGVLLVADQGASVTTIEGRISTADGSVDGCGDDSMRAVYLNSASALKGFTVTKGHTKPGLGDNNGAGAAVYSGLAVECVFSNNVASGRGNVTYGSALLRCYIGENPSTGTYGRSWDGYAGAYLIDCVHNSGRSYYSSCHAYNTTFVKSYPYNNAKAYNCIFLSGNDAKSTLYSCLTTSDEGTGTKGDDFNQFGVDKKDLPYDPVTYRPLPGSLAIDTGTDGYYALATNGWTKTKARWQSFIGTDFAGGPRRLGAAIDVGAGEADPLDRRVTITDAQTALVVTGVAKGTTILHKDETVTFTLARDYSTEKLCTGVTVNGEFLPFSGEGADKTYEYTYGYGDPVKALVIEAVYAEHNDWYVNCNIDPAKGPVGDDANDGYTKYRAKRTLAGAMANTLLKSGDTVHAAPGIYNEGEMFDGSRSNRVIVAAGVLLVGDQGASATTIEGKISDAEGNKYGCAADSLRVAKLNDGAIIKGFTLTKGRSLGHGGGVNGGLAVECVFSNNVVISDSNGRGNAACGACLLRCYIGDDPNGSWGCYSSVRLIDCVYDSPKTGYSVCSAFNTTFVRGYVYQDAAAYNCIFLSGNNANSTLYSCLTTSAEGTGNKGDDFNQFGVDKAKIPYDPATYRPLPGSPAIDKGTDSYYALATNDWTKTKTRWQSFIGTDFAGGPRKIGAAIDVGAGESDPNARTLTITDAQTALVVTGAAKGKTTLYAGQSVTFTLARDYSTAKLCTGVTVNGEFFSFTGEDADRTYEYTYGYDDPSANLVIEAVYAEHNDWYVNVNTDPEKGPVGDDANDGYTKYRPKRTLVGAMTNALLAEGDTVHAAAGVYNEGTMADSPTSTVTNRVIVKKNVGLVADEGKEVTAIEGFIPEESKWNTTDPIRAVAMGAGAYLKGFTVRNSMASMGQGTGTIYGNSGGGVSGGAAIIDCVVSNCYAVRGGGVGSESAVLIRCRITGNKNLPNGLKNPAGGSASCTATAIYYSKGIYDSEVVGGATAIGTAVNSRFSDVTHNNSDGKVFLCNCYVVSDGGRLYLTNSIVGNGKSDRSVADGRTRFNTALRFDADGRPDISDPTTAKYAIDRGDNAYYVYPDAWASEAGKDSAGGQRIYNRTVDIGAGEYDWRGAFAKTLARRGVALDVATPNVTTNLETGLDVPAGESLGMKLVLKTDGKVSFKAVADDGAAVTVTVGGEPVTPGEGGRYEFAALAGETEVEIAVTGEGQATVSDVVLPKLGTLLLVR